MPESMSVSEAGRRGNASRWKDHVKVRPYIGDLPPAARRIVWAAIKAQREKLAREKAD